MADLPLHPTVDTAGGPALYGLLAEYGSPEALLAAARHVAEAGVTRTEAYSPFAVEEVADVLDPRAAARGRRAVALSTLIAGVAGGVTGFGMCWYANVVSYPLNIGGRPLNSWPAWIPITFELTVLFAALTAAIGMLVMNGLPRLHHPLFDVPAFARASTDRFFLCVEAADPRFDPAAVRGLLAQTCPLSLTEVAG